MKKLLSFPLLLLFSLGSGFLFAQREYEIKVTLKPLRNQYIYLGHYSGKQFPVIDSVLLNANSEGTFKGANPLGGGIYIVAYPSKDRFVEFLLDKQQRFSISLDTAHFESRRFTNSPDNDLFNAYQQTMTRKGKSIDSLNTLIRTNPTDSIRLRAEVKKISGSISAYRKELIQKHPNTLLITLLHLMEEPVIPPAEKHPGGHYDSTYAYHYFKDHYWDGINFYDDRVSRTPAALFEERLDKYYNTLVYPSADSVNKELDWMLGYASASKEMSRYLLVKFITRYLTMKYMWEDAVFVHLYDKYFSQKNYDWLTPQGKKMITDRAYSLMANIMGNPAENISLPDTAGNLRLLYADTSRFTLVCFWDPTCGHCKETLPILDSMYRAKWKAAGMKIFAVGKETDGNRQDWLNFIRSKHLEEWINVYYSKAEEKLRVDANIPGYTQLYDAQTVPAVYLLDREKRIVAKKLTWQQADEILELKLKNPG